MFLCFIKVLAGGGISKMEKTVNSLIEKKEKIYLYIVSVVSIILYITAFASIVGILYLILFLLATKLLTGIYIGRLRQNAIKVSEMQFAEIYQIIKNYSSKLHLKKIPEVYILQSNGVLNAFATRFLSRNFVVLFSDILDLAYANGKEAVKFIIAHELAHVKRKHMVKMVLTGPGMLFPFLGSAYSRACESTCDNIASYLAHENPTEGLLVLLAGKRLYNKIDLGEFLKKSKEERGFWSFLAEITSSHPSLSSRLEKIQLATYSRRATTRTVTV
jgi:Zn-dependent protease with chaperone function